MTPLELTIRQDSIRDTSSSGQSDAASSLLDALQGMAPLLHERRDAFDKLRRLPDDVFDALADAGLFRLWLPKAVGGPELSPFEFMRVIEAASALDGSVGWLIGNGGGMSRVGGYVDRAVAREWFSDRRGFVAAATGAVGTATPVKGGYRVTGRWPFGSGAHHASLFFSWPWLQKHRMRLSFSAMSDARTSRFWTIGTCRAFAVPAAATSRCATCSCRRRTCIPSSN
jgi:alkylation response protein AidB-like acyl-CoA dehydrogenase